MDPPVPHQQGTPQLEDDYPVLLHEEGLFHANPDMMDPDLLSIKYFTISKRPYLAAQRGAVSFSSFLSIGL